MNKRFLVLLLFVRPALYLRLLTLVTIMLSYSNASALASGISQRLTSPVETIYPARVFTYQFETSTNDGQSHVVKLINAPQSSTLTDLGNGITEFRWIPPASVGEETVILFQLFDALNSTLVRTERMVLSRGDAESIASNRAPSAQIVIPASVSAVKVQTDSSQLKINRAPTLPDIDQQFLQIGEEFQLFVRSTDPEGSEVEITAHALPLGAEFIEVFDASYLLRWRPEQDQIGDHLLVLSAVDINDVTLRADRVVVLHVERKTTSVLHTNNELFIDNPDAIEDAPILLATQLVESVEPSDELSAGLNDEQLYIEPISSQIVSVGRTVRFPVVPRTSDDVIPFLHVDRLPVNASFDENADGTRTFYWKTTQADQGSHTFRFTAIHPSDVNLRVMAEAMVVIGDPGAIIPSVQ